MAAGPEALPDLVWRSLQQPGMGAGVGVTEQAMVPHAHNMHGAVLAGLTLTLAANICTRAASHRLLPPAPPSPYPRSLPPLTGLPLSDRGRRTHLLLADALPHTRQSMCEEPPPADQRDVAASRVLHHG